MVSTELPGVVRQLEPRLGDLLKLVPLPRMQSLDVPLEEDLPEFVDLLSSAIAGVMQKPPASERLSDHFNSLYDEPSLFRHVRYQRLQLGNQGGDISLGSFPDGWVIHPLVEMNQRIPHPGDYSPRYFGMTLS